MNEANKLLHALWNANTRTHGERLAIVDAALAQARREGLMEIDKWTDVAFYPGPIESPDFQAGYMAGIGEAKNVAARLLAKEETHG